MEIGQQSMVVPATTPLNIIPGIRICSERNCTNVLVRPFKDNICSSCSGQIRSRSGLNSTSMAREMVNATRSNPSSKSVEHGGSIPDFVLPTSVTQMLHVRSPNNLSNLSDPSLLPSPTQFLRALPSPEDIKRPHTNVPSIPVPDIGESNGTQMTPLIPPSHFDLHGELVATASMVTEQRKAFKRPRTCQRCSVLLPFEYPAELCPGCRGNMAQGSSLPSRKQYEENVALNADAQKHAMSILSGNMKAQEILGQRAPSDDAPQRVPSEDDQRSNVGDNPRKRPKLSSPQVIDLTESHVSPTPENSSDTKKLFATKSIKNSSRSLKLCVTVNCTGTIPLDSKSARCLACVRNTWKSRKSASQTEGSGANTQEVIYIRLPAKSKKKGVTWADESDSLSASRISSSSPDFDETLNTVDTTISADSGDNLQEDAMDVDETSNSEQKATHGGIPFPIQKKLRKLPERPILREEPSPLTDISNEGNSVDSAAAEDNSPDPAKDVSGWDSDLTDISTASGDLGESDSGSSESEEDKMPSTPSGLKIRIPARPAGSIYSRKCASAKCNQPLAGSYRWKSCVMCRARSREYQRKRQNLQRKHTKLDEELLEGQNIGTPLSKDFFNGKTEPEEDVTLLPGARLCSNRNCTFIIPSVEDYHWKMCSLCRIRAREQRKEEKFASMLSAQALKSPRRKMRKKKSTDAVFLLRSLDYLSRKGPKRGSGRCQSVDCGVLVPDDSLNCNQCSARREWLMSDNLKNQTADRRSVLPMKQGVKTPRGPDPYHEYKCFTSFLLEFKARLSGFIETQSIFFLFKSSNVGTALFSIDGEFSVVANDFDIIKRREEVDKGIMKFKKEIEYVGRIKFNPRRLMSILDAGGIAVRFSCLYPVPVLQPISKEGKVSTRSCAKIMQCELEIAVLPDHSHRLIPGQRTIIRFRLFG